MKNIIIKEVKDLKVGELFSFSKKGAVHMVSGVNLSYIQYKSYNDGKIRIQYKSRKQKVFMRPEYDNLFDKKWFLK